MELNLRTRLQTDGMFLVDSVSKIVDSLKRESMVFRDESIKSIEKLIIDIVLQSDYKALVYAFVMTDKVFVQDGEAESLVEMLVTDYLLSYDSMNLPQTITALITDRMLLSDTTVIQKIVGKVLVDLMYLFDSSSMVSLKEILSIDKVLLGEARQSTLLKKIEERLVLTDQLVKDLQKWVIDQTFIGDLGLFEVGTRIIEQLYMDKMVFSDVFNKLKQGVLVDNCLLSDKSIMDIHMILTESLITTDEALTTKQMFTRLLDKVVISDSAFPTRMKQITAIDTFLLFDLRLVEVRKVLRDDELTLEVISKLLTSTRIDELLFRDNSSQLIIGAIIAFLIYARLKTVNYLNIEYSSVDLLGRKLQSIDYLGRTIGIGAVARYD